MIGALVFAAAYVYRIKMEFDRAHRARAAAARAKSANSATRSRCCAPNGPSSIRRCGCRGWPSAICRSSRSTPINTTHLKNLPDRPPSFVKPGEPDPIGAMIETIEAAADAPTVTGSIPAQEDRR